MFWRNFQNCSQKRTQCIQSFYSYFFLSQQLPSDKTKQMKNNSEEKLFSASADCDVLNVFRWPLIHRFSPKSCEIAWKFEIEMKLNFSCGFDVHLWDKTKNFQFYSVNFYLFTSGDVGKLRHFRLLCDDDELPMAHSLYDEFFLNMYIICGIFSLWLQVKIFKVNSSFDAFGIFLSKIVIWM